MSIEHLLRVVPPPPQAFEIPGETVWRDVESRIGRLPDDYGEFVRAYGTGCLMSFIWIFNPASQNVNLNLCRQFVRHGETFREINRSGLEPRIAVYPEPRGLLPFGATDNGDYLLWQTSSKPSDWHVVVMPARESIKRVFRMNMTAFLAGICEGTIVCDLFPGDLLDNARTFVRQSDA